MRRMLLAAVVALIGFGTANATAGDYSPPGYKLVTITETRTVYETRTVPYTKEITKYDNYGRPYTVCVRCYKDIQVPVKKTYAYTKLVKICDY